MFTIFALIGFLLLVTAVFLYRTEKEELKDLAESFAYFGMIFFIMGIVCAGLQAVM